MEITLTIKNLENFDPKEIPRFEEIIAALISSGGLSGVKSGKTILHFDPHGVFRGVQLDYWPYKTRDGG